MAASDRTVQEVAKVILRHISSQAARGIVADLRTVEGNQSFRETIAKLADELDAQNSGLDAYMHPWTKPLD